MLKKLVIFLFMITLSHFVLANDKIELLPSDAIIYGKIKHETNGDFLGNWSNPKDYISWDLNFAKANEN